ncbi:MAG: aminopeptidase P family protein [Rickettsiaceae bacterium]|nr:aminopeptidase P family protein [Rickettsiaceae bacterium]
MNEKIRRLKALLKSHDLYGFIIPSTDEFLSEYPCEATKRLEFITEFSCSNGYLIITLDKNLFFTDGRYLTAAHAHFKDVEVYPLNQIKHIIGQIMSGGKFGYNPKLFAPYEAGLFSGLDLTPTDDFVDMIWENKPLLPSDDVFEYKLEYAGESAESKIIRVRDEIEKLGANGMIVTSPESVCWLLNIRGDDSEFSPIVHSCLYLGLDEIVLFSTKRKFPEFLENHVDLRGFEEFDEFLEKNSKKLLVPGDSSIYLQSKIPPGLMIKGEDPSLLFRAVKNTVEIEGAKKAHIRDAVALIEFLCWLEKNYHGKTEYELSARLTSFRKEMPDYIKDSFAPIVGFGPNGSKIHYKPEKKNSLRIKRKGVLLIDSGGHYFGGTTDVTRTILLGKEVGQDIKTYYTNVLKGHIDLSKIRFPAGIKGCHLDVLARMNLWQSGIDYNHGTGHGVGNCLSVHEGPSGISLYSTKYALVEGMILSNEPGYYKENEFGIRIENLQYVRKSEYQGFLEFEPLTLVPYCKSLVEVSMLNSDQLEYIRNYYAMIQNELQNLLSPEASEFLAAQIDL